MARIVALPHKEKGSEGGAPPSEEVKPAAVAAAAAPRGPSQASLADSGTALKRQRGKARKKEVPARIISLPTRKTGAAFAAALQRGSRGWGSATDRRGQARPWGG